MDDDSIQQSILGAIVKKREDFFIGAAKIIPAWISPNAITIARILLIIPIYFAYRQELYWLMIILFMIALVSDATDGAHARYHNKVTKLGKLLDPASDKIIFVGVLLMIAIGRLSTAVIITILGFELLLVLFAVVLGPIVILFLKKKPRLGANIGGKMKMGFEGLSLIILMFGLHSDPIILIAEIVMWLAVFFALLSIILHITTKEKEGA